MPKPTLSKKETKKKRDSSSGWDWSGFGTDEAAKKEKAAQSAKSTQTGSGTKSSGWDWSSLPTSQAQEDEQQKRYQQQMEQARAANANAAIQDTATRASDYIQDRLRGGIRSVTGGLTGQRDYTAEDLTVQDSRYRRDLDRYSQMAQDARKYGSRELYDRAQSGLQRSGGSYDEAFARYSQAQDRARADYLKDLQQNNRSQYYGETMSREQIEQKLGQLARDKGRAVAYSDYATGQAGSAEDRAKVGSGQPEYMRQLWDAKAQSDEIDAEIARYQAALRYRDSLDRDNEMAEIARSISESANFREMAEVGKAMVENRNRSARASVNSADYQPDDPDNNLQFAKAERQEREALSRAGYVGDLDSSYIPEEVKPIYYALFAQNPQKAAEFAAYWAEKGEAARWNALYEKSGEDAGERARAFIEGTFANTVAGLDPFGEGGQYAAKLGKTKIGGGAAGLTEKGLFNTGFGAGTYHSDLFGDISLGSAYQLGSSMLQSAANATIAKMTGGAAGLVGGAGTILLGSSAAAQDYQEKLEQGWDEGSAKLHALLAGTAESVFEYVSLDKLINQDVTRGFLKNILVQGGVEASEEALTTIANRVTDGVISELSGNESQIEARARELMEKGYEKGTAEKMAQQEWLTELMSDALGGFLSGGLMSSGQYALQPVYRAMGAIEARQQNERTGALSSRTGEAAALAQYAADNNLEWASPEQLAEAVKPGEAGNETNLNESTLGQQVSEAAEQKKTRQELRQERKANRQTGKDVNRARNHIQEQMAGKTVQEQQTVRDELIQKYGEAIAPTVSRAITMETAKQAMQLDSTDAIRQARETVLAEIQDEDMKRAVADGYDQAAYAKISQSDNAYEADRYIQQLRTTGTGTMSMEATVSAQDGQSRKVAITGMTEDGKGVKLADGATVAVSKLQADADTMDVIQQMADLDMGQDADEVFRAYQRSGVTGTEGYRWLMNYATAYNQGRVNSVSLEEAAARSSLDGRTVLEAYTLGQRSAHRETQQGLEKLEKLPKRKGVTGRTSNISTDEIKGEAMNDSERQQFDYANRIVSALGTNLTWFSSKADDKGRYIGKNGAYENGTIYMDIHAGRNFENDLYSGILATMSHELSHFQQQYAPKEYQELKQFLFRQIAQNSKGGEDALERLIWEKQRRSGNKLSRRQAEDEVVADACQKMIRDSKAIHEFAKEHESAVAGMVRWLKDWFKKLRAIFNRSSATFSHEAELMDRLEADVKKAFGELWDKGLREAVRVHDEVGDIEGSQEQNSDRDTEYLELAKDPEKNAARLQEMVDEKAKEAGYTIKAYHGTTEDFTEFSRGKQGQNHKGYLEFGAGFYFTPSEKEASSWAERGKNGPARAKDSKVMAVYLNPGRIIDADAAIPGGAEYLQSFGLSKADAAFVANRTYRFINYLLEDKGYSNLEVQETLKALGYDAIESTYRNRTEGQYVVFDPEQIKSADPVTYDDKHKPIPLSERFNDENRDIRFQMREPVETTDRLIAWHNMNEDALRSALELGGLAMPSWAIKTADRAHTSYGKISVIAPRELVDPKLNRSSMIFGGDAWTPVFPDIDYDVSFEAAEDLYDEITGLIGENVMRELGGASIDTQNIAQQLSNNGGAVSNYYKNNVALRYAYLKSIGKDINVPRREVRLDQSGQYDNQAVQMFAERLVNGKRSLQYFRSMTGREVMQQEDLKKAISDVMVARHGEAVRDLYASDELSFRNVEAMLSAANRFFENGGDVPSETDRYALAKEIDKVIDEAAYEKWIGEKLNKTVTKKGVYNGKDPFTPSGNRRSFDALHYAYNLANIVKAMKSQPKQGRTQFLSGPGSVKGAALKSYNTVEQVRKDRGRLVNSAEEGQAAYDAYNRNLEDILDRMSKNGDRFDAADALIEVFQHAKTETAIYNYMQRELKDWYNISRELAHDAYELIGQINQLPMEYFEGKTYDAVRFDETAAVVVPDDIDSALKRQLENAGARVVEYKAGDDADRLEKVNSVEEAKFSERDYELPSDLELMDQAAESLSEAGGEEYWKALLESVPELAGDQEELKRLAKDYKDQAEKLEQARKTLQEQLQTTNRKLNTAGISGMVLDMMKQMQAHDAWNKGVAKQLVAIITDTYQKALDAVDEGASAMAANDIIYEGAMKAADVLAHQSTHSEKYSYKWTTASLLTYYGEGGMQAIQDQVAATMGADFAMHRYRQPIQATAADRIVEQTERRMQKKVDAANAKNEALDRENKKLTEQRDELQQNWQKAAEQVTFLGDQLKDARDDFKAAKSQNSKEKTKLANRIKSLEAQRNAKAKEAKAWKERYEAEARQSAANAKEARDQRLAKFGQSMRAVDAEVALGRERINAQGWEKIADQTAKQLDREMEQKRRLIRKLEAQVQREADILTGKLKPLPMQRLLQAAREEARRKAEEHKDEVFQNYKERQRQGDLRRRIKNLGDEMKRRMTNPSERAYVPASLYESMTRLADVLDDVLSPKPGTKAAAKYRAMMDAIHGLAREYAGVKNLDDPVYSSEYDQEIQDAIRDIERILERKDASWIDELTGDTKKGLQELSTGELQRLYELMRDINYAMVGATAMLGHSGFKNVFDAMRSVAEQQQTITPLNEAGKVETAKRSRLMHKLSTMRAVEMMSGWQRDAALYQLMHDIEQGVADSDGWVMNYDKSMQALKTGKNELEYRRAISKKLDDYNVKDARGNKVLMTKMQALQVLMTAEREAHNDKLVHLQKGGAVIRDRNAGTSYTIKVTPELIQKIQNSLTEWDRAYMKAIRSYFQKEGKRTNEILYRLKHRVLQTEEYYVPYNVDKNYLETKLDSPEAAMSMWVKTPGATNALAQKASQPVYIDGMDTVMGQHVREIANYIGMAIPIRDFSKVYNGMLKQGDGVNPLPVKETIHNNYGDDGQRLLTQAIIDVQGGRKPNEHRTQLGKLLDKLQSAFYRKSLLINAGVTLKQAASYVAAESILSHKALERGNHPAWTKEDASNAFGVGGLIRHLFLTPSGKTAQRLFNEIDEHTSLHYQRRQGMSMQELAQEANRSGRIKTRLGLIGAGMEQYKGGHTARMIAESVDPLNWIQRMDVATTAALWVACKEQAKLDGMKSGTQEYWNHVTELYERCIRETQPMYDTLHRSEDQKDRSGLMQYLFPFRTVPIQNHGQLAASFEAFKAAQKSGDEARIKQAGTFFRKTAIAQTLSAAVFAAFTLFAAAAKRKTKKYRDEDEELTPESLGFGVGRDIFGTLFSVFFPMFGSAAWDTINTGIDYARSGKEAFSYDAFSIGVADMLNNLWQTGGDLGKDVIDLIAGHELNSDDVVKHIGKMVVSGLECAGVPTTTAKSYWNGIKGNFDDLKEGRIPALNDESWDRKIGVNAQRLVKAAQAGDSQKVNSVLEEMRGNILEEKPNLKEDKVNGRIQNAVTSYVKGLFLDGKLSETEATKLMVQYGSSDDEDEAYWKIREWEAKVAHADDDEYSFNKYEDLRAILADNGDISSEVKRLTDHGVKADSVNKDVKATIKDLFNDGTITEDEAMEMLQKYHQTKDDKTKQYRADTADEAWFIVDEWKEGAENDEEDFNYTKYSDLREAIRTGGNVKDEIDLLTGHGVTEKAVYEDVNKTINTMLSDGAINGDKAEDLLRKYGKVKDSETKAYRAIAEDEAWAKVREWQGNIEHADEEDYSYGKYDEIDAAIDGNKDIKTLVKELTDHGTKEKDVTDHVKSYLVERYVAGKANESQLKNQLGRYLGIVAKADVDKILKDANSKKLYGVAYSSLDEEYRAGNIGKAELRQALMKQGGMSGAEADLKIRYYDLQKANPNLEISESRANTWYDGTSYTKTNGRESAKTAGMSISEYLRAKDELAKVQGVDANGDGRTDTGSREIAYIRALTAMSWLTDRQRRALYYEEYKGTSKTSSRPF